MEPIIHIKTPRYASLLAIPFVWALMYLFAEFILLHPDPDNPPPGFFKVFAVMVLLVGVFLTVVFTRMAFWPKPIFSADAQGFTMNPNGVELGPVRWEEIAEVREMLLTVGGFSTPVRVLGVILKDPDSYSKRFNPLLRGAMKLNTNIRDASFYVEPTWLREHESTFCRLVAEKTGKPVVKLSDE